MAKQFYARRGPFQYGPRVPDDVVDLDQIIHGFGENINDERMLRLGQIAEVPKGISVVECGKCTRRFISDRALSNHGRIRHEKRNTGPQIQDDPKGMTARQIEQGLGGAELSLGADVAQDTEVTSHEKMLEERPIHFDKSEASLKAGEGIAEITTTEVGSEDEPSSPDESPRRRNRRPVVTESEE